MSRRASTQRTYVIGDAHGQIEKLARLLQGVALVDGDLSWTGSAATLVFMGDLTDRGPDGVGVVELVMRLQREATTASGRVECLLGNHDLLLVAARRFGKGFWLSWLRNGGCEPDLDRLTPEHEEWLLGLPAMLKTGQNLLAHADATFYNHYGASVREVNEGIRALIQGDDTRAWNHLLDRFSERHAFDGPNGATAAARFLSRYGARRLIHGHTPIQKVSSRSPEEITEPHVYATGLCVNVDGGMYRGGPGFVYELLGD